MLRGRWASGGRRGWRPAQCNTAEAQLSRLRPSAVRRLALPGLLDGCVGATSNLLAPGRLSFSLVPAGETAAGRAILSGRLYIGTEKDR